MEYFDDFEEFDVMMNEFKHSIIKNVTEDIQKKIDRLESENKELKYRLSHLTELEKAANDKMHEADLLIRNSKTEAARQRVIDLTSNIGLDAWAAKYEYKYIKEKCDKCDENRKIHFKSPSGNALIEDCECAKTRCVYTPEPVKLGKLYFDNGLKEACFYFVKDNSNYSDEAYLIGTGEHYFYIRYNGGPFEKLDSWRTFFMNYDDCKNFCEYKNEKAKNRHDD